MDQPAAAFSVLDPVFRSHLEAVLPIDGDAIDLGTGTGRVALQVAPRCRRVVGVDVDESSLEAARWLAERQSVTNARFVQADAERVDLGSLNDGVPYALVTARLFFSLPLVVRVATALEPGGNLIVEALEAQHWQEAGGSRFNLVTDEVTRALQDAGFNVLDVRIVAHAEAFGDASAAQSHLKDQRVWAKWKRDGRWDAWRARARRDGFRLTTSHLILRALRATA